MIANFQEFLARNSVSASQSLPLVHSTASYNLGSIAQTKLIVPQVCDVFNTPLSYFFVGRPAYKPTPGEGDSEEWELPSCFIFEYEAIQPFRRVFPFDSGAFSKNRMPRYISMMPIENFEVSNVTDAPLKIIGALFGNVKRYISGSPLSMEHLEGNFSLDSFDAEVKAVHRLAMERRHSAIDDRRMTIEVQVDRDVDLRVTKPIAVVAPMSYFGNKSFKKTVTSDWGAVPIGYPITSLNVSSYYSDIYNRVFKVYKKLGII